MTRLHFDLFRCLRMLLTLSHTLHTAQFDQLIRPLQLEPTLHSLGGSSGQQRFTIELVAATAPRNTDSKPP
jgi:hypothetical protein